MKLKLLTTNLIIKLIFCFFNISFLILFTLKYKNKNIIRTALCVIAKEENKYIKEYVEYYKQLRINKIFLYDNNDINGEKFDIILKKFINKDFVKIINYRGFYKPQKQAYKNCYNINKYKYNWIAFFDVDEYLYILNYSNINIFLSSEKFNNCTSLLINWKYYGDNNNLFYEPKPLKERFKNEVLLNKKIKNNKYLYAAAKTIARGGLNIIWRHFPHFLKNKPICKADGQIILNPLLSPPQYNIAYIKHYITKSVEEYFKKTIKGTVNSRIINYTNFVSDRINKFYFIFNKKTKIKINLFITLLNLNKK